MALRIPSLKPWQWAVLVLGAIVVVACGVIFLRVVSPKEAVAYITELGPIPFFVSMAVLPAFGAPVTPWYLLAGPAFGLEVAIIGCVSAISANIALTYLAARWVVRPLAVQIVERAGYKVPVVRRENRWLVTTLIRFTPGPPFFIQSYVLGLANVPFSVYMLVSVPAASILGIGAIVFGESLLSGKSGGILVGGMLIVVAIVAIRLFRKNLQRKAQARQLDTTEPEANLE